MIVSAGYKALDVSDIWLLGQINSYYNCSYYYVEICITNYNNAVNGGFTRIKMQ